MDKVQKLGQLMIEYMQGDARRIQHFIKVHSLAKLIGEQEELPEHTQFILESAAYTHDIGIRNVERRLGHCNGKQQEEEGPQEAAQLLAQLDYSAEDSARIQYLIGHHHTYTNIDGSDYQILVEADFLVNFYEDGCSLEAIQTAYQKLFKTQSGRRMCQLMFGVEA